MNDSLYNPDTMSKEDIKTLFVARQPLLNDLVATIRNQPKGAGVQHLLIIAPRGMGKTTMLLMLQFSVEDNADLAENWQAVRFPEESYGITELADFWLKVLDYLDDESLKPKIEEIKENFIKSEDLREAAWALVKDWSKHNKKRILLLVDNFDMILQQIGSQTEQARLRDILMNDGTVMLVGCAPSYFSEIQDYEQPLHNFFKIHNLDDLKFMDIKNLLRRRANIDDLTNFEKTLKENKTRIKALEAFTGGNPRLVLMLYRIITSSDMTVVRKSLEKLLDAVTPYYKDKTEKLPPQQRKIINQIAEYSLQKREGVSPTEIAQRIRMTPNQVSTQLKRLADNGYVKALNMRGRSSFYALSEPLYAIWAQMRFGRNAREKRKWLVSILKALYDTQELSEQSQKLDKRFNNYLEDGKLGQAKDVLEHHLCIAEAMSKSKDAQNAFESIVHGYLKLEDLETFKKEILMPEILRKLTTKTLKTLKKNKYISTNDYADTYRELYRKGLKYLNVEEEKPKSSLIKKALDIFNKITENASDYSDVWIARGIALRYLNRNEEAIESFDQVLKIKKDMSDAWLFRSFSLIELGNKEEAIKSLSRYIEFEPNSESERIRKIDLLGELGKHKEVVKDCSELLKLNPESHFAWHDKAVALENLHKHEEALECIEQAVKTDPKCLSAWNQRGISLLIKARTALWNNNLEEAKTATLNAIESFEKGQEDKWSEIVSEFFINMAKDINLQKTSELIEQTKLSDELFPIVRAIKYLETNDENLIEKLSPEVRIVVKEILKTLQTNENFEPLQNQKEKTKKDKANEK